jgi:hypothetical protein
LVGGTVDSQSRPRPMAKPYTVTSDSGNQKNAANITVRAK